MTQSDPLFLVHSIASYVPTNLPPSQKGGEGATCQCPLYLSEEQILDSLEIRRGQRGQHIAILPMHQQISDSSTSPGNLRRSEVYYLFMKLLSIDT